MPFAIWMPRGGFAAAVPVEIEETYTVAAGLRQFFTQYTTDWGSAMAGSTIITVPVMLFFVAVQRRLSSGLAAGAVKG